MSTKEQVEELVTLATIGDTVALRREAIAKLATLARSAVPSGQVAEDLERLRWVVASFGFHTAVHRELAESALSRLAAGAQRAKDWEDSFHRVNHELARTQQERLTWMHKAEEMVAENARLDAAERRSRAEAVRRTKERDELRSEVERLKELSDRWSADAKAWKDDAEEQRKRAEKVEAAEADFQRRVKDEALAMGLEPRYCNAASRAIIDELACRLCKPDASADMPSLVETVTVTGGMVGHSQKIIAQATRYPCSLTCTHDDARNPGHAERARQRSEVWTAESVAAFNGCQNDRERVCYGAGWEKGLDSMREACWEAIQPLLTEIGLGPLEKERWKDAIESSAP
jgi:hypothetical protein